MYLSCFKYSTLNQRKLHMCRSKRKTSTENLQLAKIFGFAQSWESPKMLLRDAWNSFFLIHVLAYLNVQTIYFVTISKCTSNKFEGENVSGRWAVDMSPRGYRDAVCRPGVVPCFSLASSMRSHSKLAVVRVEHRRLQIVQQRSIGRTTIVTRGAFLDCWIWKFRAEQWASPPIDYSGTYNILLFISRYFDISLCMKYL